MNESTCRGIVKLRMVSFDPSLHELGSFMPCECCGVWTDRVEMHHRKFRSRGGLWLPSNILGLCPNCHNLATNESWLANNRGLNVATHQDPAVMPVKLWHRQQPVLLTDSGTYLPAYP